MCARVECGLSRTLGTTVFVHKKNQNGRSVNLLAVGEAAEQLKKRTSSTHPSRHRVILNPGAA